MPARKPGTIDTSQKGLGTLERQLQALELRKRGIPYRDIARALGWASASTAYEAVQKLLEKRVRENADELVEMELERLDHLYQTLLKTAMGGGRGAARAAEVAIKVLERRSKLLGLDAAEQKELTVRMPEVVEYFRDENQDEHRATVDAIVNG